MGEFLFLMTYTIYSAAVLIYYQCFLFYFIKWTIGHPILYGGFLGCAMFPHLLVNWSLLSGHWFIESFEKTHFEVRRKNYEDFIFLEHFFYFVKKTFFFSFKKKKKKKKKKKS